VFAISDILSQSEINELLKNLIDGEADVEPEVSQSSRKIRDYDFKMPKKLSKEQVKVLSGIHESFARQMASYFSGILRIYCEISVLYIEEQHYFEYNNALPDTVLMGVIEAAPIEGFIVVDISNSITYNLIERMLGGGTRESNLIPDREFTEIELSLMERIYKQMAIYVKDAWSDILPVEAALKNIETNSRLVQSIAMDEIVVIVGMDVTIGNIKGSINFCIPCLNIEPIIDKMRQNRYSSKRALDISQEEFIKDSLTTNIKAAPLEMHAIFGETVLSLKDILNLQIGDVIKFDQDVASNVKINVNNGETWFYGIPGIKNNKKAIKISKDVKKKGSCGYGQ